MPKTVIGQNGSPTQVATMEDISGGATTITADSITDATTTGKALVRAADEAAARSAIGAGTSSLTVGTTATTAKAGNYQPTVADISDATAFGRQLMQCADADAVKALLGL